jgi:hypothetical protein
MKAQELNSTHIGLDVVVRIGQATIADTLTGIRSSADIISDGVPLGSVNGRPDAYLGRRHLTLEFKVAGDVAADLDSVVTIPGVQVEGKPVSQHWLTENHNADPVCSCGWNPGHDMSPREMPITRTKRRELVRRHIRANQPLAANTGHPDDDR